MIKHNSLEMNLKMSTESAPKLLSSLFEMPQGGIMTGGAAVFYMF
jgi:hypothetical protein